MLQAIGVVELTTDKYGSCPQGAMFQNTEPTKAFQAMQDKRRINNRTKLLMQKKKINYD